MVTIVMPVFANISRTEHASAVKFHMDYEKNMSNILVPKSQKVWKKVEEIGLSSFKAKGEKPVLRSNRFQKFGWYVFFFYQNDPKTA